MNGGYFVKVKRKDAKRYRFLSDGGKVSPLQIYALRFEGENAKQAAESVRDEIIKSNAGIVAKIQRYTYKQEPTP